MFDPSSWLPGTKTGLYLPHPHHDLHAPFLHNSFRCFTSASLLLIMARRDQPFALAQSTPNPFGTATAKPGAVVTDQVRAELAGLAPDGVSGGQQVRVA
jgi:hypothetical protein